MENFVGIDAEDLCQVVAAAGLPFTSHQPAFDHGIYFRFEKGGKDPAHLVYVGAGREGHNIVRVNQRFIDQIAGDESEEIIYPFNEFGQIIVGVEPEFRPPFCRPLPVLVIAVAGQVNDAEIFVFDEVDDGL